MRCERCLVCVYYPMYDGRFCMQEYIDSEGVVLTREEFKAGLGKGRVRQVLTGFEASIVDESKLPETDLNQIVARIMRGETPEFKPGVFVDVSELRTFQEVQDKLVEMESAFMQLPAPVREVFENSAAVFADALQDPARQGELVELGIVKAAAAAGDPPGGSSGSGDGSPVTPAAS